LRQNFFYFRIDAGPSLEKCIFLLRNLRSTPFLKQKKWINFFQTYQRHTSTCLHFFEIRVISLFFRNVINAGKYEIKKSTYLECSNLLKFLVSNSLGSRTCVIINNKKAQNDQKAKPLTIWFLSVLEKAKWQSCPFLRPVKF
jgi:hypothetical protein